jgi:hypothetical protein
MQIKFSVILRRNFNPLRDFHFMLQHQKLNQTFSLF